MFSKPQHKDCVTGVQDSKNISDYIIVRKLLREIQFIILVEKDCERPSVFRGLSLW